MTYTVYRHISPSGKVYVGITRRKPSSRWGINGRGYLGGNQKLFANAINKYGWDNFIHEILLTNISKEEAKYAEKYLIRWYKIHKISYNITDGGDSVSEKAIRKGKDNPMYGRHETNPAYGKFGKEHPASKKVYQYSLNGEYIREWDSLTEAVKSLGFTQKEVTYITACCNGRRNQFLGFIWKFYKQDKIKPVKSFKVYKYDSTTGELLGEYKNAVEASHSIIGNPSSSSIINCCNNKSESAYGYIWKRFKVNKLEFTLSYRAKARQGYENKQINKPRTTSTK